MTDFPTVVGFAHLEIGSNQTGNVFTLPAPAEKFLVFTGISGGTTGFPSFTNDFSTVEYADMNMGGVAGAFRFYAGLYQGPPTTEFSVEWLGQEGFGYPGTFMLIGLSDAADFSWLYLATTAASGPPHTHPSISWSTSQNLILRGLFSPGGVDGGLEPSWSGNEYTSGYVSVTEDFDSSSLYVGIAPPLSTNYTGIESVSYPSNVYAFTVKVSGSGATGTLPPPEAGGNNPAPVGANVVPI